MVDDLEGWRVGEGVGHRRLGEGRGKGLGWKYKHTLYLCPAADPVEKTMNKIKITVTPFPII